MEFIIWGLSPKNPDHEEPLHTRCRNQREVDATMEILRTHGCTEMRVQILDLTDDPGKMFIGKDIFK